MVASSSAICERENIIQLCSMRELE